MPELDEQHLRAALRDLYEAALPQVRPPGPDAVRHQVGRRAALRAATLATAVCAAILTVILIRPLAVREVPPAGDPTPTPTPTLSPTGTESALPTVSSSASTPDPAAQSTACDPNPRLGLSYTEPTVRFWLYSPSGAPVCAGTMLYFTWMSYYYAQDGRQIRHSGATWGVFAGHTYTDNVRLPTTCRGDLYLISGISSESGELNVGVIEAGQHHPFPIASEANNWHGTIYSEIVPTSPCIAASSPPPTTDGVPQVSPPGPIVV